MNYPRKLTIIFAKNLTQYQITNCEDLTKMINKIKFQVTNSHHIPIVKVIWTENWKDFNFKTDDDYKIFENFYKDTLKLN